MNEEVKITCSNDVYKYSPDQIYDKFDDLQTREQKVQNNWNELKKFIEKDIKRWEDEEKKWIEQGFMKFGGEANNKIIFKKVLNKMQELEDK